MNNKELISNVAVKLNLSKEETQALTDTFVECCISQLKENKAIDLQSFGKLEVVKHVEQVSINPASKEQLLIPPELVLDFKQSPILQEKINTKL